MLNFRILRDRLLRGGIAGLKAEVMLWVVLAALSAVIYVITSVF